jgi:hypothetical protein
MEMSNAPDERSVVILMYLVICVVVYLFVACCTQRKEIVVVEEKAAEKREQRIKRAPIAAMEWHSEYTWDEKMKTIRFRGLACKGLTKAMRETLYPGAEDVADDLHGNVNEVSGIGAFVKRRPRKGYRDGAETGNAIAVHLETWLGLEAELMNAGIPSPSFESNGFVVSYPPEMSDEQKYMARSVLNNRCPYTRQFLFVLQQLKWRLVGVEVPVGYNGSRVATKVDAVAMDTSSRCHAIEIKCGYDRVFNNSSGEMEGPVQGIPDCPLNQHLIQLACTHNMLRSTFPCVQLGCPVLIRFHHTFDMDKDLHLLPKWLTERWPQLHEWLLSFPSRHAGDRKKKTDQVLELK